MNKTSAVNKEKNYKWRLHVHCSHECYRDYWFEYKPAINIVDKRFFFVTQDERFVECNGIYLLEEL